MAKKILLLFALMAFLICLNHKVSLQTPHYLGPEDQISTDNLMEKQIFDVIKAINDKNKKLKNLYVPSISIRVKHQMTFGATGRIYFEKEKLYKMTVRSIFGQEMDIGSNDTHFWFWSKRMNPPDLFYARHEDLDRAMLKTPLNPSWMIESLTLSEIPIKDVEVGEFKGNWIIKQKRKAARGEDVVVATLIAKDNPRVLGNYLYNSQGKMIASTEISNHYEIQNVLVPKTMFITWHEEGLTMEWRLNSPQINVNISKSVWDLPSHLRKIELR